MAINTATHRAMQTELYKVTFEGESFTLRADQLAAVAALVEAAWADGRAGVTEGMSDALAAAHKAVYRALSIPATHTQA